MNRRGSGRNVMVGSPQQLSRRFSQQQESVAHLVSPISLRDLMGISGTGGRKKPENVPLFLLTKSQEKLIKTLKKQLEEKEKTILQQEAEIDTLKRRLGRSERRSGGGSSPGSSRSEDGAKLPSAKKKKTDPTEENPATSGLGLDVPKFRENPLSRLSGRETRDREALDDDSFYKRHFKSEMEEKKMIRRDLMRQRDAEMLKKLQQSPRYASYVGKGKKKTKTSKQEEDEGSKEFDPEFIESIQIVHHLPKSVIAIG